MVSERKTSFMYQDRRVLNANLDDLTFFPSNLRLFLKCQDLCLPYRKSGREKVSFTIVGYSSAPNGGTVRASPPAQLFWDFLSFWSLLFQAPRLLPFSSTSFHILASGLLHSESCCQRWILEVMPIIYDILYLLLDRKNWSWTRWLDICLCFHSYPLPPPGPWFPVKEFTPSSFSVMEFGVG